MNINHYYLYRLEKKVEEQPNLNRENDKHYLPFYIQAVEFTRLRREPLKTGIKGLTKQNYKCLAKE